jgi:hypothetical protein
MADGRPAPVAPPPKRSSKTPPKAPAAIAAAVLVAAPLATQFEGYRGKAYYDPAHILTACYGETEGVDPSRIYSKDECAAKLRTRMARDYAPAVLNCLPQLADERRARCSARCSTPAITPAPLRSAKAAWRRRFVPATGRAPVAASSGGMSPRKNRKTGVRTQLPGLVRAARPNRACACRARCCPSGGPGRAAADRAAAAGPGTAAARPSSVADGSHRGLSHRIFGVK